MSKSVTVMAAVFLMIFVNFISVLNTSSNLNSALVNDFSSYSVNLPIVGYDAKKPVDEMLVYFSGNTGVTIRNITINALEVQINMLANRNLIGSYTSAFSNNSFLFSGSTFIRIISPDTIHRDGDLIVLSSDIDIRDVSLSPDSLLLAVANSGPLTVQSADSSEQFALRANLIIYNLKTHKSVNLFDKSRISAGSLIGPDSPRWSPDGKYLSFDALNKKTGTRDIFVVATNCLQNEAAICAIKDTADAILSAQRMADKNDPQTPEIWHQADWSPDSKRLVFVCGYNLCIMAYDHGSLKRLVLPENTLPINPRWSPDGQYLLYLQQSNLLWIYNYISGQQYSIKPHGTVNGFEWLTSAQASAWVNTSKVTFVPKLPLRLVAVCSNNPNKLREWKIYNDNEIGVWFSYRLGIDSKSKPTVDVISGVVSRIPGEESVTTATLPGDNTLQIFLNGVLQDTKPSINDQCPTPVPTSPMYSF